MSPQVLKDDLKMQLLQFSSFNFFQEIEANKKVSDGFVLSCCKDRMARQWGSDILLARAYRREKNSIATLALMLALFSQLPSRGQYRLFIVPLALL